MTVGRQGLVTRILAALAAMGCLSGCAPGNGRSIAVASGIPHPALIAHRGASHLAPEETRAAYTLARELGAAAAAGAAQVVALAGIARVRRAVRLR